MLRFLIYLFLQTLYMFRAAPLPIIRSTKTIHTASGIGNQYCCLLLSWMRWNSIEFHLIHDSRKQQYWLTIPEDVCMVFVLLMMGGETA